MEKKAKWNFNAGLLVGILFTAMGSIYCICGIGSFFFPSGEDADVVAAIFTLLGSVFLASGILLAAIAVRQKKTADRLLEDGHCVWGTITELRKDRHIHVLYWHPVVALVHYQDASGVAHTFRSRHIYRIPSQALIGEPVRVYIQQGKTKPYYVDIDSTLSQLSRK